MAPRTEDHDMARSKPSEQVYPGVSASFGAPDEDFQSR